MYYQIINSCDVSLWGVSQKDRIAKVLAKIGNPEPVNRMSEVSESDKILLLDANYLLEANVIVRLIAKDQGILLSSAFCTCLRPH